MWDWAVALGGEGGSRLLAVSEVLAGMFVSKVLRNTLATPGK
jgi:hypothetical protein